MNMKVLLISPKQSSIDKFFVHPMFSSVIACSKILGKIHTRMVLAILFVGKITSTYIYF